MKPSGFKKKVSEILRDKKSKRRMLTVAVCLALVAVLGIVGALPSEGWTGAGVGKELACPVSLHYHADTCYNFEGDLTCGKANYVIHKHDEKLCYDEDVLVCPLDEHELHEHTDACYELRRELTCQQEEHVHSDECYTSDVAGQTYESVLDCGQEEHEHGDTCYDLTCIQDEHTHNDSCWISETPVCGQGEHAHDDSCWISETPVCGQGEHAHDDSCWISEVPACGFDEHEHDDACYGLTCELELHAHDDNCYTQVPAEASMDANEPELICEYGEYGAHTHDSSCYEEIKVYTCGEQNKPHRHDASCFGEDGSYTCGLLELIDHSHTIEGCFVNAAVEEEDEPVVSEDAQVMTPEGSQQENRAPATYDDDSKEPVEKTGETETDITATCPDPPGCVEGPMPLSEKNITYVLSYFDEKGNKQVVPKDADLFDYLDYKLEVQVVVNANVDLSIEHLEKHGLKIDFQFNDYFSLVEPTDGGVKDKYNSSVTAADVHCDKTTNTATVEFIPKYIEDSKNANVNELEDLKFVVMGWFNAETILQGETIEDVFGNFVIDMEGKDKEFWGKYTSLDLEKEIVPDADGKSLQMDADGYYVEYILTVTAGRFGAKNVSVTDSACRNNISWQDRWLLDKNEGYGPYGGFEEIQDLDGQKTDVTDPDRYDFTDLPPLDGENRGKGLEWVIGDMGPEEVRTLTYKLYLDPDYVEKNKESTMTNEAVVGSNGEHLERAHEKVDFTGDAEVIKKQVGDVVMDDFGAKITYMIRIKADDGNNHALDLILQDYMSDYKHPKSGNGIWMTSRDLWKYIHYLEDSVEVYKGDLSDKDISDIRKNYQEKRLTDETVTWTNGDDINSPLEFTVKDLEPGGYLTILYSIRVDNAAIDMSNDLITLRNAALLSNDKMPDDTDITGQFHNNADVKYDFKLSEKLKKSAEKSEIKSLEEIKMDGEVYQYPDGWIKEENGKKKAELNPNGALDKDDTGSFTLEPGTYYKYTVEVNPKGIWSVSGWTMEDLLAQKDYMEYVGYVKVTAVRKDAEGNVVGEPKTVWVNVDGYYGFSFTGNQLGFTDNETGNWTYTLDYYTRPVGNFAEIEYRNDFYLDRRTGVSNRVGTSTSQKVQGKREFAAGKLFWYYDSQEKPNHPNWNDNGALYWLLKIDGSVIPKNLKLTDNPQKNNANNASHLTRGTASLVGGYIADQDVTFSEDYRIGQFLEDVRTREDWRELTQGNSDQYEYKADKTGTDNPYVIIQRDLEIPAGKSLYFVVRSNPMTMPSSEIGPVYYKNSLNVVQPDTGLSTNYEAQTHLVTGDYVDKKFGTLFYTDGKGNIVNKNNGLAGEKADDVPNHYVGGDASDSSQKDLQVMKYFSNATGKAEWIEAGLYASWVVRVNMNGDFQGICDVMDKLPDGMELKSVVLANSPWHAAGGQPPKPEHINDPGWVEHTSTTRNEYPLNNVNNYTNWKTGWPYYTSGNQVMWRVNIQKPVDGGDYKSKSKAVMLEFVVTCRVTDEDVLLGGSIGSEDNSTPFTNHVDLYTVTENGERGPRVDADEATVIIDHDAQLFKDSVMPDNGNIVTFTIDVNPTGEDLVDGDTITIVDFMSSTLIVNPDTVKLYSSLEPDVPYNKWPLNNRIDITYGNDGGTTLTITLPDSVHLYVKYDAQVDMVPEDGNKADFKNEVSFSGHKTTPAGKVEREDFQYISGGEVGQKNPQLTVKKRDATNIQLPLGGAEFKLESIMRLVQIDDGTYRLQQLAEGDSDWYSKEETTGINGDAVFENYDDGEGNKGTISTRVVYRLEETAPPEGGYVPSDKPTLFIIARDDKEEEACEKIKKEVEEYKDLKIFKYTQVTLTIYNSRGDITVTKKFVDLAGKDLDKSTIPAGEYKFGLYRFNPDTKEEEPVMINGNEHYIMTITVPGGGTNTGDEDFTCTFKNLERGTYYVYELLYHEDGTYEPITSDEQRLELSNMVFQAKYEGNNDGIKLGSDASSGEISSGEVTVSNVKCDSYRLPETGGSTAASLLTVGGILLIGASLAVIMKKRMGMQK